MCISSTSGMANLVLDGSETTWTDWPKVIPVLYLSVADQSTTDQQSLINRHAIRRFRPAMQPAVIRSRSYIDGTCDAWLLPEVD